MFESEVVQPTFRFRREFFGKGEAVGEHSLGDVFES
jgi:hypothetical protein